MKEAMLRIEQEMQAPNFWGDRTHATARAEELSRLKRETNRWERFQSEIGALEELAAMADADTATADELARQYEALEREVLAAEREELFRGPYDRGNAVLSIFAGAGGKDAEDWAAILRRMYERFAERSGYKLRTIHEHFGELRGPGGWGMKNAAIEIRGPYAYGKLKRESGVHRLVRISPFNAKSLRHTSFALVEVMPELVAPSEVELKPEELEIDFFRSSGPGGQNVNKRETAVRITHKPTGIQVAVQVERSQDRNREIALEHLRAKLYQLKLRAQEREAASIKGADVSIEWGNQIRSYVLHPYQLVKDHRTNYETSQTDRVLDGELDDFIEAELQI